MLNAKNEDSKKDVKSQPAFQPDETRSEAIDSSKTLLDGFLDATLSEEVLIYVDDQSVEMKADSGQPGSRFAKEETIPAEWRVGDVILDLYEVKQVITGGGMGLVYRVHHRDWAIDMAVKSPKLGFFKTDIHKKNFSREAETWVNLGLHPHIVSCFYVRTLGDIPRVFAEYIEGGSLSDWIRSRKIYEGEQNEVLERMLDIAIQVAWGLDYAHEFENEQGGERRTGLIHRDVKPANILLTLDGRAMVTDFGLAQGRAVAGESEMDIQQPGHATSVPGAGAMTRAYASPEQVSKETLTRQTDIWSWGVSVLEMYKGGRTWEYGEAAYHLLAEYLNSSAIDPGIPKMPKSLADLLQHCFQKDPTKRPATMAEVADTLQAIYAQTVGHAFPRQRPQAAELLADGLNNKALSLMDIKEYGNVEDIWEKALKVDPSHIEANFNLGLRRWRSGRMSDIALIEKLQEVWTIHYGNWRPLYLLGMLHLERDDCESAIKVISEIEEVEVNQKEVQFILNKAQERLPNSSRLLYKFKRSVGDRPQSIFISQDEQFAVSSSENTGKIELWSVADGDLLHTFEGHMGAIRAVSISVNSKLLLSGGDDKTLRVWDIQNHTCFKVIKGHTNAIFSVQFNQEGTKAISGSGDRTVQLWDVESGECIKIFTGHTGSVTAVAYSADERFIISGSYDKTIRLWNVESGECLRVFTGHESAVKSVPLSRDGRYILSGAADSTRWTSRGGMSGQDNTLKLWDLENGQCLKTFEGHTTGVGAVYLDPESKYAVSASLAGGGMYVLSTPPDPSIKIWDMESGACLRTIERKNLPGWIYSIAISFDGNKVLCGNGASYTGQIEVWQVGSRIHSIPASWQLSRIQTGEEALKKQRIFNRELENAEHAFAVGDWDTAAQHIRIARTQAGFERDKKAFALWQNLYTHLPRISLRAGWKTNTLLGHAGIVHTISMSTNGKVICSGSHDQTIRVWDADSGECTHVFDEHKHMIFDVCLTPDGLNALSIGGDGKIKYWDTRTGQCLHAIEDPFFSSMRMSSNGKIALSSHSNGALKVWDVETGECTQVLNGHAQEIGSLCLSKDGRLAISCGKDGVLKLWDLNAGQCSHVLEEHVTGIAVVDLSGDGRFAISGGYSDRVLKIWDTNTGACINTIGGQMQYIALLKLSEDGRIAVTASHDGMMSLWNIENGQCLHNIQNQTGQILSIDLSTHGQFALVNQKNEEYKLFETESGKCLKSFIGGHTSWVLCVDYSSDGRFVLSGSRDNSLRLWDVESGKCLKTFQGHRGDINSVCLSHDSRYALSASNDSTIKLWDVASGGCLQTFVGHSTKVNSIYVSNDASFAVSGSSDKTIRIWDLQSGKCLKIFNGHTDEVTSIAITKDDRFILSGSWDRTLRLWDINTGEILRTFEGHDGEITSVCLSADGKFALSGSRDKTLLLWDLKSGDRLQTYDGHKEEIFSVCLSADGTLALSASKDRMLKLWNVATGENITTIGKFDSEILTTVRFSPDGKFAVSGGWSNSLHIWKLESGEKVRSFEKHSDMSVCLSSDGSFLVSACDPDAKTIYQWEVKTGACLKTFDGHAQAVKSLCLDPGGKYMLSSSFQDNCTKLWNIENGECIKSLQGIASSPIFLSENGNFSLSNRSQPHILWDIKNGGPRHIMQNHQGVSIDLSSDGIYALSGGRDKKVKLWDIASGRCLHSFEGHQDVVSSVKISQDQQLALSGSNDKTLKLWDMTSGQCLHTFEGHKNNITSVQISRDQRLVISGSQDKTLKLWDVSSGQCLRTFEGHTHMVTSICLSADGRHALSGDQGNFLKLWDVRNGECLLSISGNHTGKINSVDMSTDGRYAISGSGGQQTEDCVINIWALDWELAGLEMEVDK